MNNAFRRIILRYIILIFLDSIKIKWIFHRARTVCIYIYVVSLHKSVCNYIYIYLELNELICMKCFLPLALTFLALCVCVMVSLRVRETFIVFILHLMYSSRST